MFVYHKYGETTINPFDDFRLSSQLDLKLSGDAITEAYKPGLN